MSEGLLTWCGSTNDYIQRGQGGPSGARQNWPLVLADFASTYRGVVCMRWVGGYEGPCIKQEINEMCKFGRRAADVEED